MPVLSAWTVWGLRHESAHLRCWHLLRNKAVVPSTQCSEAQRPDLAVTRSGSLPTRAYVSSREPLAGLCVLVVEDDPASTKLLSIALAGEGAEVHTVTSAADAIACIGRFAPRLIVLELVLPCMNGLLLAQRLKGNPATRHITIIAVTAFNGPETERVTRSAGCDAYIRRPIDVHSFARLVATHMGERS